MKLIVFDRIILGNILPVVKEHFEILEIIETLRMDLSFSEEEHKLLNFKNAGDIFTDEKGKEQIVGAGQIKWKIINGKDAIPEKEVKIGEKAKSVIVKLLKELEEAKPCQLGFEHMSLYRKFIKSK